jgi:3-dehydroquinate synthetase
MPLPAITTFDTPLQTPSPYFFGSGIAGQFPEYLNRREFDRCFLVTSPKLLQLIGQPLLKAIDAAAVRCNTVLIDDAERNKDWDTLRTVCEELTARGATRDSVLLAFGGGVIGNVTGLAAALVYRGIRFVHVPTTVTAQTDSTLSNKQAINGAMGKNQFGVYHAPLFIWADADYPAREPVRQQKAGIVEGVKNVFISQPSTDAADEMLDLWRNPERLAELLLWITRSKLDILRQDPTERASALVLEYGHTFGHAIEWLGRGRLLHGEAISIGMCLAADLSHALGHMSAEFRDAHYRILGQRLGTPTTLPGWIATETLYETMLADNKRTRKGLRFLLLRRCGEFADAGGDPLISADRSIVLQVLEESRSRSAEVAVRR